MNRSFPQAIQLHRLVLAIAVTVLIADTYPHPQLSPGAVETNGHKVITLIQKPQAE